jgi:hypothetical protein
MPEPQETLDCRLTKYQELYALAKDAFAQELARSASIEQKATVYISILTFLLGIFGFFSRQVLAAILPPQDVLSWVLAVTLAAFLLLVICTWFLLFRILRLYRYSKIPIPIEFFHENKLATVYYGMAKGIRENLNINREHGDRKGRLLDRAYDLMRLMVIILVSLCILFGVHSWLKTP